MTPVNDDAYETFAGGDLSPADMEALAANAEQDADIDQAIRHNLYIGWVLGITRDRQLLFTHGGGNRIQLEGLPGITLTVPYPPAEWRP